MGRGSGTITSDGCPVENYMALTPHGKSGIIHVASPLAWQSWSWGAGRGRTADPLVAARHRRSP